MLTAPSHTAGEKAEQHNHTRSTLWHFLFQLPFSQPRDLPKGNKNPMFAPKPVSEYLYQLYSSPQTGNCPSIPELGNGQAAVGASIKPSPAQQQRGGGLAPTLTQPRGGRRVKTALAKEKRRDSKEHILYTSISLFLQKQNNRGLQTSGCRGRKLEVGADNKQASGTFSARRAAL